MKRTSLMSMETSRISILGRRSGPRRKARRLLGRRIPSAAMSNVNLRRSKATGDINVIVMAAQGQIIPKIEILNAAK